MNLLVPQEDEYMSVTSLPSLRIAYLCLQATTEGQASHAHVHEVISGLRALGHSVDLFEPRYAGRKAPNALGRLIEFERIQRNLVRRLGEYDVLYVRGHPFALPTSLAAKRRGMVTIQECNGPYEDFAQAWPAARVVESSLAAMARRQFRDADGVIAVTPQLADWLREDTGQPNVTVVPNGANIDLFSPGRQRLEGLPEHYAVFFGSLQPWQGIDTILDAARDASWPSDLPVVIAGDGQLAADVRAAALQSPGRVIYIGRLQYDAVADLVSNALVSLIGFNTGQRTGGVSPIKLYESMAAGVPVIAANLPGQAEDISDAACGILVDPITPEAVAKAVAQIVDDPVTARAMGRRARAQAVDRHSWTARAGSTSEFMAAAWSSRSVPLAKSQGSPRIAYLSLQAVVDGQDTWAAVTEIISGIEQDGWTVDPYFPDYPHGVAPGAFGRVLEMSRVQLRLWRALSRYDALYVRAHPAAFPIAGIAHRRGIPVVQECNGPYEDLFIAWPSTRVGRPVFEQMQRYQYRIASAIVSVAEGLTEWLRAESANSHIVTNGNGANIETFRPDVPRFPGLPEQYAVFFGQFPAWQGIPALLEAVRSREWPDGLKLIFVGDGSMRPLIEDAVRALPERVGYLGRLPYEQVPQVASHSVVSFVPMVAPEREAKFSPLKLYESMACGVPVVASDTIGISEVVNEFDCGILVTPGDADAIVRATARLLADPDMARAMGARGHRAAVEHFSWRARARQRRVVIEEAIERESHERSAPIV